MLLAAALHRVPCPLCLRSATSPGHPSRTSGLGGERPRASVSPCDVTSAGLRLQVGAERDLLPLPR